MDRPQMIAVIEDDDFSDDELVEEREEDAKDLWQESSDEENDDGSGNDWVIRCSRKENHNLLRDYQRFRTVLVDDNRGKQYRYYFELDMEHMRLTRLYLYRKNFKKLPLETALLWVCSVRKPHDDMERFYIDDIRWHFSVVETKIELNSKHKGIIDELSPNDALLCAGEMYIGNTTILWNERTGALRKLIKTNSKALKAPFRHYMQHILQNYEERPTHDFKYEWNIIKNFAPPPDMKYVDEFYVQNDFAEARRTRLESR